MHNTRANICSNQAGAPVRRVTCGSPLIARHVEVGTQRAPHIPRLHSVFDGLRRGTPTEGRQHMVDQHRRTVGRPKPAGDKLVKLRQTHTVTLGPPVRPGTPVPDPRQRWRPQQPGERPRGNAAPPTPGRSPTPENLDSTAAPIRHFLAAQHDSPVPTGHHRQEPQPWAPRPATPCSESHVPHHKPPDQPRTAGDPGAPARQSPRTAVPTRAVPARK